MSLLEIPVTFILAHPGFRGDNVFTSFSPWLSIPISLGKHPTRFQWTCWFDKGIHLSWDAGESWLHKGTQWRLRKQLGASPVRMVKTQVQIIGLPLGGWRGDWSPPKTHHSNPVWGDTMSLRFSKQNKSVLHTHTNTHFSWEKVTTEVKGWITKIQFQSRRLKRTDVSSTNPPDSPLVMV
jgi:hypothetical protein